MPMAAARGAGVTYRKTEQAEPHGGGGQGVIAFAAVLVAGLLFAGGAAAIFLGAPPPTATPTRAAVTEPTLPPFVQLTATPGPETPVPSPSTSAGPNLSPDASPGTSPDLSPGASPESPGFSEPPTTGSPPSTDPGVPTATPTRRPTATPTRRPTPTPTDRPTATPTDTPTDRPPTAPPATPTQPPPQGDCNSATGPVRDFVIGFGNGNAESRGPIDRDWCVVGATFGWFESFGVTRLYDDQNIVATSRCAPPGPCDASDEQGVSPPHRVAAGSTLYYFFRCIDNPGTTIDECSDNTPDGATIQVFYRVLDGS